MNAIDSIMEAYRNLDGTPARLQGLASVIRREFNPPLTNPNQDTLEIKGQFGTTHVNVHGVVSTSVVRVSDSDEYQFLLCITPEWESAEKERLALLADLFKESLFGDFGLRLG